MGQTLETPLPKWLRKAVKHRVLSLSEAQDWHLHVTMYEHQDRISLPPSLHRAAAAVHLFERQAAVA